MRSGQLCFTALWLSMLSGMPGSVYGQSSTIGAPITGFAIDSETHSIRPIRGIPRASVMGDPLPFAMDAQTASFSASGQFALVTDNQRRLVLIQGFAGGLPSVQPIGGAISSVDLMVLNGSGSAVVYSSATGQIQFLSGLPDNPAASTPGSLSSAPGAITALAIAVGGNSALAAYSDGTYGGVYEIANASGAAPQSIASAYQPSAVAYVNNDQDAVLADAFTNEIDLIQGVHGNRTRNVLVSARDGVQNPIALQAFNALLLIADAGSQNVIAYDLTASSVTSTTPVPVAPTHFGTLNVPGFFSLNDAGSGPLYLYSAPDSSVLFVPPNLTDGRRTSPATARQGGSAQ
jgi:hypothetical protein